MVERQLRRRGIDDERVLRGHGRGCRASCSSPKAQRRRAYRDGAVRIGEGQTMSQPWIVACMTQLLELEGPERVLEVGTGSGYGAAVLSRLCREVVTVERYESLAVDGGSRRCGSSATTTSSWVVGDGEPRCAGARALRRDLGHCHREGRCRRRRSRAARARRGAGLPGRARPPRAPDGLPRRGRGGGHGACASSPWSRASRDPRVLRRRRRDPQPAAAARHVAVVRILARRDPRPCRRATPRKSF